MMVADEATMQDLWNENDGLRAHLADRRKELEKCRAERDALRAELGRIKGVGPLDDVAYDALHAAYCRVAAERDALLTVLEHDVIEIANLAAMVDPAQTAEYMTAVYDAIAKARGKGTEDG